MSNAVFTASNAEIENLILEKKLIALLPTDWDSELKIRQGRVTSATQRNNKLRTRRFWLTFLGMLPICLFALDVWPAFGITFLSGTFSLILSLCIAWLAMEVEEVEATDDGYVELEKRIVAALERLNHDDKIMERALADSFIKQSWINNFNARRRIETDIESARRAIGNYTYLEASNKSAGKPASAFAARDLADAQAMLSVALAELTASGAWTYPDMAKCRTNYQIERDGYMGTRQ
ncbi:hypothetical protein [Pseudorhodobacter ferrugineus]|uniref:hypothetical protein n=1 Tax=Pseudorhodobacter ferrugineus TaxID=77008 RepID=UPI0003B437F5|nr:hypothetical protein [Pseudorhodobacter ferrugineus]